jgi:hypothetical protein
MSQFRCRVPARSLAYAGIATFGASVVTPSTAVRALTAKPTEPGKV